MADRLDLFSLATASRATPSAVRRAAWTLALWPVGLTALVAGCYGGVLRQMDLVALAAALGVLIALTDAVLQRRLHPVRTRFARAVRGTEAAALASEWSDVERHAARLALRQHRQREDRGWRLRDNWRDAVMAPIVAVAFFDTVGEVAPFAGCGVGVLGAWLAARAAQAGRLHGVLRPMLARIAAHQIERIEEAAGEGA